MLSTFVFKNTIVYIHVARVPTNTNHIVCLRFTHSIMKQFVSSFKFKWFIPLNPQHPAFCAQVYTHVIMVQRPQVPLVNLQGY
jgi:hypothetical protein